MSHQSTLLSEGNFTLTGFPIPNNYFAVSNKHRGPGIPLSVRILLFDGTPIATTTNALATSQSFASTQTNATFLATKEITNVAINAAGSGYAEGDILTGSNGTGTATATLLVSKVSPAGAITGVNILNAGLYSTALTTVTGGNGSGATFVFTTTQTQIGGQTAYMLDYARKVTFGLSSNTTVFTVKGWDIFGNKQSETVTISATTSGTTTKTYSALYSITTSVTVASFVCGVSSVFGLPVYLGSTNYWNANFNGAADAGTVTVGVATSPATVTSGDPRGLYTPAGTPDAAKRLTVWADVPFNYLNSSASEANLNPRWVVGVANYNVGGW